jgi:hypothetical protein
VKTIRFSKPYDYGDLVGAYYKGHAIDCVASSRRAGQWNVCVRAASGELVAEATYQGKSRRAMLVLGAESAGLVSVPNDRSEPRPCNLPPTSTLNEKPDGCGRWL